MKLSDFVPKGQETNRKALSSAIMIMRVDAVVFFASAVLIFVFKYTNFDAGVNICYFTSIASIIHPLLMYYFDKITVPIYFFSFATVITFFTLALYSGGLNSSYAFWLITIVPIGMFYLKKYEAVLWCAISFSSILGLAFIDYIALLPVNQLSETAINVTNIINLIGVCFIFIYTVYNFKTFNEKITRKLARVNKRLESSNEELEKFASIASHDLKSPLRNISGFLDLLRRKKDQFDSQSIEFIEIIDSNAKSMTRLIEDILEYSRSNGTELQTEMVDLNKSASQIKTQIANSKVFPNCIIKIDKLPNIKTDKTRIHQIFQNLIENGLKYNRSENPKMEVRYHMRNNQHHFEFMDNGIGIDAKHAGRIFEMFQRLHGQSEFQGSGIGLSTTKKNTQILGGTIKFISVPGRGTTFRVHLPADKEDYLPTTILTPKFRTTGLIGKFLP